MNTLKKLAIRIFDVCIIAMLIYGDDNMQTFGLCVAAFMAVVAFISLANLKPESAAAIHSTLIWRSIGILINCAYAYALIVSGSPIWAAFYILVFLATRIIAADVVDKAKGVAQ